MSDSTDFEAGFGRIHGLAKARGLTEIEASTHYGTPALKVADAAFVRMLDPATAVLQCPVDQKVLLMEISPDIYFETDHYVGHDAMLIHLDQISDEELSLRLADAWAFKAPQRLKSGSSD